jgi:hypothetical protein
VLLVLGLGGAALGQAGSLDTGFSFDGKATTPIGTSDDYANGVAVQADGRIVAAGYSRNGYNDFALARYNPDRLGSGALLSARKAPARFCR